MSAGRQRGGPRPNQPRRVVTRFARDFNEGAMGLMALVALASASGPMAFDLSPATEGVLTIVEWVLVRILAAEFVISGLVAPYFQVHFSEGKPVLKNSGYECKATVSPCKWIFGALKSTSPLALTNATACSTPSRIVGSSE